MKDNKVKIVITSRRQEIENEIKILEIEQDVMLLALFEAMQENNENEKNNIKNRLIEIDSEINTLKRQI